jgi:protoporphyrinogen oxidase
MDKKKRAVIIGAGPAGLTAAFELLTRTDIEVIVLEATGQTGGISQTVEYKGNRMDIGGHRFFSKSDRVMKWWLDMLPIEPGAAAGENLTLTYQSRTRTVSPEIRSGNPEDTDRVMLVRNRLSRIYYGRKFYSYPIRFDLNTIANLGAGRIIRIGWSYFSARIRPVKPERSLEDFFINRFGRELYETFFRDYTEKVWGVPCSQIKPEWGAQRVKGLSVSKAILHAVRSVLPRGKSVRQKNTETSLIERFLYPKFGPGQLWQVVAGRVEHLGGIIRHNHAVVRIESYENRVTGVWCRQRPDADEEFVPADFVFSTMPVQDLLRGMGARVPESVRTVSDGLQYRDFITIGLLYTKMIVSQPEQTGNRMVPDNWIYIQESDVKVGRIQVFNNWSPYMVNDNETVWLGLEYFCQEGDSLWINSDEDLIGKGVSELEKMGFCAPEDFLDATVVRMPKTYPGYFGTYDRFDVIRHFTDSFANLFLIGRNGMHRYNNQDHSMLTAMTAVDLIIAGRTDKEPVWAVNTEEDYHENSSK